MYFHCNLATHPRKPRIVLLALDQRLNPATQANNKDSLSFLPTVVGVIERCGRYVQQLSFGQRWLRISQPIIDCIASKCNRLRVVDLGAVILSADLSPLLEKIAPQLEEFSLEETSWINNQYAAKVQNYFKDMKRLRKLNLRSAMFQLTKLADLPMTLKFIEISGAHAFPPEVLLEFLEGRDELEEFYASPVPMLDDDIIDAIGSLPNLRHLSLGHNQNSELNFEGLAFLTKLETLRFNVSSNCIIFKITKKVLKASAMIGSLDPLALDPFRHWSNQ
ncbi:unnamed protein product [Cylicostephanus goldi]|uniref:Uncharacterized protein n=1 Tax=Cylicostephanus goldi TaxID=71465 RepID=A0A3P7N891_CYLGO|nr:unnamed protein product [Cylicostephanus goldi]